MSESDQGEVPMDRKAVLPFLQFFVTAVMEDGSEHSGFISNYDEIKNADSDDIGIKLLNGMYVETIPLAKITSMMVSDRENTTSIPVIDLKNGYQNINDPEHEDK
jgi:hypothetical protein